MTRDGSPTTEGVAKHTETYNHGAELFLNLSPLKTYINMYIHTQSFRCIRVPAWSWLCVDSVCVNAAICIMKHFASKRSSLTCVSVGSGCDKGSCV